MTTTTHRPTEAICPPWCQGHAGPFQSWEELTNGHGFIRSHFSPVTSVGAVEVMFGREEHHQSGMKPCTVDINIGLDGAIISAEQARELARVLLEAADRIEAVQ